MTLLQNHWEQLKAEFIKDQQEDSEKDGPDPLVEEAIKLVGEELIEITDR